MEHWQLGISERCQRIRTGQQSESKLALRLLSDCQHCPDVAACAAQAMQTVGFRNSDGALDSLVGHRPGSKKMVFSTQPEHQISFLGDRPAEQTEAWMCFRTS